MEGWFLGAPISSIRHDNVSSWVSWAFFGHDEADMTAAEKNENETYVSYISAQLQWTFPPGRNENVHSIRLTLDPLFATQRPFFYYAVISLVNHFGHFVLWLLGYRRRRGVVAGTPTPSGKSDPIHRIRTSEGMWIEAEPQSIYHRPAKRSPSTGSTKNGNEKVASKGTMPVVFVHGIGIGFAHYLLVLAALPADVDIYLLEWPHVSMQLSSLVSWYWCGMEGSVAYIGRVSFLHAFV